MTPKTATNQNGQTIMVIGEHVNKYLSLNKQGIIKSRTVTMPEVGLKQNAFDHSEAQCLRSEVER